MSHHAGKAIIAAFALVISAVASATKYVPISVGNITVIIPINEAPVSADDTFKFNQSDVLQQLSLPIFDNDWDEELATSTIEIVSAGTNSVVPAADGSLTYTVPANWYGSDMLTYRITDSEGETSEVATVNITINALPVAADKQAEILTELMICDAATTPNTVCVESIDLLLGATDADNQVLRIENFAASNAGHDFVSAIDYDVQSQFGLARLQDGILHYYPKQSFFENTNACRCDVFTYQVSDGNGGLVSKTVTIALGNVRPNAMNDAYFVTSGRDESFYVLDNDMDPEGKALTITRVLHVPDGSVASIKTDADNRQYIYFRNNEYQQNLNFVYEITDEEGLTDVGIIRLTVQALGTTPEPVFQPSSGTYGPLIEVDILGDQLGTKFYYTTDGSDPTTSSPRLITSTFDLTYTTAVRTVKAIAVNNNYMPSPVVEVKYQHTLANTTPLNFSAPPSRVFPGGTVNLSWQRAPGVTNNSKFKLFVTRPDTSCGPLEEQLTLSSDTSTSSARQLNCEGTYQYHIQQCNHLSQDCGPRTSVEVRVSGFEPASVTATPSQIQAGQSTTIRWTPDPEQPSNATYKLTVIRPHEQNKDPLDVLKSKETGTSSTHTLSYDNGTYVFLVQVCNVGGHYCGQAKRTFVTVGNGPIVNKFTWNPAEILVGQESTFEWNVENVTGCTATTSGNGSGSSRDAVGQVAYPFYAAETHVTQWYCNDLDGRRFPAQGFLEATRVVNKLSAPANLGEQ